MSSLSFSEMVRIIDTISRDGPDALYTQYITNVGI